MRQLTAAKLAFIGLAASTSVAAMAQESGLMSRSVGELRPEIDRRYNDALTATQSPAYVRADTQAYLWAMEAKVQCGIAHGFLRSNTKDPVSIGRCERASDRMVAVAADVPPPPPPPPVAENRGPSLLFFDWDSSDLTAASASILDDVAQAYAAGGQAQLQLAGHADKSGSDDYNVGLSQRRADAVKAYLVGKGVPPGAITTEAFGESRPQVDTADGVREPQNRRVEITTIAAQ